MGATFKIADGKRRSQFASVGELLGGVRVKTTRSFQPVRRNSYAANDRRAQAVWRPLGKPHEGRKIAYLTLKAAEGFELRHKQFGRQNGPLGHTGLEVLRYFFRRVDYRTGRLDPALDTIATDIGRSKETVNKAIGRLKAHGFVVAVRRAEVTGFQGSGPQIRQLSNAYGLRIPKVVAEWMARNWSNPPLPDCDHWRRQAENEVFEAMLDQLSAEAQTLVTIGGDGSMAEAIVALARAWDRNRASPVSGQNPSKSI